MLAICVMPLDARDSLNVGIREADLITAYRETLKFMLRGARPELFFLGFQTTRCILSLDELAMTPKSKAFTVLVFAESLGRISNERNSRDMTRKWLEAALPNDMRTQLHRATESL